MSRHIGKDLAEEIIRRAQERCEYCLISNKDTYFGMEIDQ
jgi:hypothetical protein